ncbi:MAG: hypothetical protein KGI71_06070 [Patescibacteria group bacterium]|nr:hypothetical protein [Patescibacteria group bacterium]
MKGTIDKAIRAAEQELEEKEIQHLKNTIQNLLQRKKSKEKERDEIEREISLIKQDIEDFKKGRLDKIQERHEKDPNAAKASPINITIINDNSRVVYPTQPWHWNYAVSWGLNSQTIPLNAQNAFYTYNCSGTTSATFSQGTYEINGQIINL